MIRSERPYRGSTVTYLRGEAENAEGSTIVSRGFVRVGGPEKLCDSEVSAFDPQLGGLLHGVEGHHATVGATDKDSRIIK